MHDQPDDSLPLGIKLDHIKAVADLVCVWAQTNEHEFPDVLKHTISSAMDVIINEADAALELVLFARGELK